MVIETDLHLNSRHPDYNRAAVQRLVQTAQAYLKDDRRDATIRLVCNRTAKFKPYSTPADAGEDVRSATSHHYRGSILCSWAGSLRVLVIS
jgi:hypothetical protein